MKQFALGSLMACAFSAMSGSFAATVVYPTGAYPTDVQNVQAAVDLGGTVLLKATNASGVPTPFDFGPPVAASGFVSLQHDVELIGETVGATSTTIDGGWYPIRATAAVKVSVRGIVFDAPLEGALSFRNPLLDVQIIGNQVLDVTGFPGVSGTFATAILVRGGRAVIEDNVIEDVDAEFGIGIEQLQATGPIEIVGNRVIRVNSIAIESSRNADTVTITDNVLRPGVELFPTGSGGTGIEINGTGSYYVAQNDIVHEVACCSAAILVFGTQFFGFGPVDGAIIEKNRIVVTAGDDGIDVIGLVSHTYIGQNNISGTTFGAIDLFDQLPAFGASDLGSNTIVGNNIARAQSSFADFFFDDAVHDTVVKGNGGSVLDLGTNNRVSGVTRGGPGTGQQISEAVRRRNEAAQFAQRQAPLGP